MAYKINEDLYIGNTNKQLKDLLVPVHDAYSTSTTDTYSCNYINGIIKSGSNENGRYIKFADGTMICYKTIIVSGINITNKWGSLYENSSDILLGNFAQTFKEKPTVNLTKSDGHGCFIQVHDQISTTSVGRCYVASATSRSNASLTFEITAIGRWK